MMLQLEDYPVELYGSYSKETSFNLNMTDPCKVTTIQPSFTEILEISSIVGAGDQVYLIKNFKDNISV